jgi:phage gp36-like protein
VAQYATEAELISLQIPTAALAGVTAMGIDPEDHLIQASGKVDTYLRGRYRLPLSAPYPDEIKMVTLQLAAYTIICARGFDANEPADVTFRMQYDDAIMWLREIAAGKVSLDVAADATPTVHDGRPVVRSRARTSTDRFRDIDDDC